MSRRSNGPTFRDFTNLKTKENMGPLQAQKQAAHDPKLIEEHNTDGKEEDLV